MVRRQNGLNKQFYHSRISRLPLVRHKPILGLNLKRWHMIIIIILKFVVLIIAAESVQLPILWTKANQGYRTRPTHIIILLTLSGVRSMDEAHAAHPLLIESINFLYKY